MIKKNKLYTFIMVFALISTALVISLYLMNNLRQSNNLSSEDSSPILSSNQIDSIADINLQAETPISKVNKDLQFIAEEEKLAGDVYAFLYDKWGSKVFQNISSSETNHQKLVKNYMTANNVEILSKQEFGQFTNQDLQALYNELTAKGSTSLSEAISVGIYIEQKDIADLSQMISDNANNPELIDVLNKLLSGSESHLKAFSRQAS